jgi:TRAP-type mannitol/chloroaromatic compound transport system substrate-binding protein
VRRRSLLARGTAGAASALAAGSVQSQSTARWRLAIGFPAALETICGSAQVFAKMVTRLSAGRFEVTAYPAGEIVPAYEVLDAVERGTIEACYTSSYFFFSRDETFAIGSAIPFGMNSRGQYAWATNGPGRDLMRDYYASHGLVSFPCGNTGAQMGGWFRNEIKSLDELRGLKFRTHGFAGRIFERLGATPVNLAGAEILPALQSGAIQGARWMLPDDDAKLGIDRAASFYYYPAWWEGSAQFDVFVNQRAYNQLPEAYRKMIEVAAAHAHAYMQATYDTRNPDALKLLVARGAKLQRFPKDIMSAAFSQAMGYYDELAGRNPQWRRIYQAYSTFRRDQSLWFRFAEAAFDDFMQAQKL